MKKAAVIILVVMLMLSAVSVFAEENPEKIQFSFGSMTIEDVAICEKAELGLAHKTMTINGKTTESTFPSIVTAKDGFIYFAIKGQLMNSSVEDILYENMIGSAVFGDNEAIPFRINPIVDVTSDAFKTCYSGSIIDVMAFTTVEKGVLESSDSCVIQVGETTLEYDLSAIDRVEQFGMDAVAEEQKNKSEEKEKNEKSEENTLKKIEYNPEIAIVDEDYGILCHCGIHRPHHPTPIPHDGADGHLRRHQGHQEGPGRGGPHHSGHDVEAV